MRLLPLLAVLATASAQQRTIESILPSLEYGGMCTSAVDLRNLSEGSVRLAVEGHGSSGALVPLRGQAGVNARLAPRERVTYQFDAEGQADSGWVKVRESVPPDGSPVVAVQGITECVVGEQLRRVVRSAAFPTRSPWFSGDVAELEGSEISLINSFGVGGYGQRLLFFGLAVFPCRSRVGAGLFGIVPRAGPAVRHSTLSGQAGKQLAFLGENAGQRHPAADAASGRYFGAIVPGGFDGSIRGRSNACKIMSRSRLGNQLPLVCKNSLSLSPSPRRPFLELPT